MFLHLQINVYVCVCLPSLGCVHVAFFGDTNGKFSSRCMCDGKGKYRHVMRHRLVLIKFQCRCRQYMETFVKIKRPSTKTTVIIVATSKIPSTDVAFFTITIVVVWSRCGLSERTIFGWQIVIDGDFSCFQNCPPARRCICKVVVMLLPHAVLLRLVVILPRRHAAI